MLARRNLIEMFEEGAFETEFEALRVLRRPCFLCNSPESVKFALGSRKPGRERKAPQVRHALSPVIGDGLFISDGETWLRRRPIVTPPIHASRLPAYAPYMVETAREFRDRWAGHDGPLDVLSECGDLTAEVLCRSLFGHELGKRYAREIVGGFADYQREIDRIDPLSWLGFPDWFPRYRSRALRRSVRRIHGVLEEIIGTHRKRAAVERSVVGRLLEARDEQTGAPLSDEVVRNEIAVLFLAGHEGTANSLTWTWYLLSQDREVEARFHAELDAVLGEREPTIEDLPALRFTRAVYEESLRLYPPVPVIPRETLEDEVFEGVRIPRGSFLFVVPWLLHRHKKLWRDPDAFIPDRFLGENANVISKYQFVPFGIGPRICPGMAFGATEALLCLATIGQRLRLRMAPGVTVRPVCRLTLRPAGGLPMVAEARPGAQGRGG